MSDKRRFFQIKQGGRIHCLFNGVFVIILTLMLIMAIPFVAMSSIEVYPRTTYATLEYDNNVTRERLPKNYQYGAVWWLDTGFGLKNLIPIGSLDTKAEYRLWMRDVNTTNDEDFNSHKAILTSKAELKTGTSMSLEEAFEIRNSQGDLFNFYNNYLTMIVDQPLGRKTITRFAYRNEQKWFQDSAPQVQAQNYLYHQAGIDMNHDISDTFGVSLGYVYQYVMYNRSPIEFKGSRPIVLEGIQRDRQNVVTLGFWVFPFNNTSVELINQFVNSNSNSRAFDFSGNRTRITILSNPFRDLYLDFTYRIVAYELAAYQTPAMGYELGEIRTDDQSGIKVGATYNISDQISLKLGYERVENTVFFTREFYKKNTFSSELKIKF